MKKRKRIITDSEILESLFFGTYNHAAFKLLKSFVFSMNRGIATFTDASDFCSDQRNAFIQKV